VLDGVRGTSKQIRDDIPCCCHVMARVSVRVFTGCDRNATTNLQRVLRGNIFGQGQTDTAALFCFSAPPWKEQAFTCATFHLKNEQDW